MSRAEIPICSVLSDHQVPIEWLEGNSQRKDANAFSLDDTHDESEFETIGIEVIDEPDGVRIRVGTLVLIPNANEATDGRSDETLSDSVRNLESAKDAAFTTVPLVVVRYVNPITNCVRVVSIPS